MSSEIFTGSEPPKRSSLAVLRRKCQSEYRNLSQASNIDALRVLRVGQVQGLTVFAPIDLGVRAPGLRHIATFLLEHVGHVVPPFQMTAAELALGVLFITRTLPQFLQFYFVIGKLRRSLRACGFGCRQRSLPSSRGPR